MYLYLYKNLKLFRTDASERLTPALFKQDLSHAVSQTITISPWQARPSLPLHSPYKEPTPWYSSIAEQFCELKRERRQAERRWLKSKLSVHKQIYDSIKQKVTNLVD